MTRILTRDGRNHTSIFAGEIDWQVVTDVADFLGNQTDCAVLCEAVIAHFVVQVKVTTNEFTHIASVRGGNPLIDWLRRVVVEPAHYQLDVARVVDVITVKHN